MANTNPTIAEQPPFRTAEVAVAVQDYLGPDGVVTKVIRLQIGDFSCLLPLDGALRLSTSLKRQADAVRGNPE